MSLLSRNKSLSIPNIGELDQEVKVRKRQDIPVGFDTLDSIYHEEFTTWAKVTQVSSSVYLNSKQTGSTITHYFILRYRNGIDANSEIIWYQNVYRVDRVRLLGKREFLLIECEEIGEDE